MPRYRLLLEYDGGPFVGWQRQDNGPSVQAALEDAVQRFSGDRVVVHGAGRTDAGVHASGQVAHLDLDKPRSPDVIRDAVNFHLKPDPIAVLAVDEVGADFHARYSARERAYLYRICNRRARPALDRGRCWWLAKPLNADAMDAAARVLVGRHDFTTFRATFCQAASPVKTLHRLDVARTGDDILIDARARSFLHHQVRNMVGSLMLVGSGKWSPADLQSALRARDRRKGGPTAPAEGLFLVRITYDDEPPKDGQPDGAGTANADT